MVAVRVKPIIPPINTPDLAKIAREELRKEARTVERELGFPTRKWKHKVNFYQKDVRGAVEVGTDDAVYNMLDKGTKAHTIRPKKAKVLRFNTVFRAKTRPDSLSSSGGKSAPPVAHAMQVRHPGTKPRNWKRLVAKRSKVRFPAAVNKRVLQALRKRR